MDEPESLSCRVDTKSDAVSHPAMDQPAPLSYRTVDEEDASKSKPAYRKSDFLSSIFLSAAAGALIDRVFDTLPVMTIAVTLFSLVVELSNYWRGRQG